MDYFYKDNYKEGMTVYLLYTGYDLCVGKYAPRKKYSSLIIMGSKMKHRYMYIRIFLPGQEQRKRKSCFVH